MQNRMGSKSFSYSLKLTLKVIWVGVSLLMGPLPQNVAVHPQNFQTVTFEILRNTFCIDACNIPNGAVDS